MATTTNFGWETPDDTDLVKDGAAAMRTLGSAIDTSLVDLKGGTTGQVLSKTTNTDMDFTWVTPQVGDITEVSAGTGISGGGTSGSVTITNSMATAIDAKGDLIAGTGADAFSRLAVGTNGQVLTADSTAATGLKWATASAGMSLINTLTMSGTGTGGASIDNVFTSAYEHYKLIMFMTGNSGATTNISMALRASGSTTTANYYSLFANLESVYGAGSNNTGTDEWYLGNGYSASDNNLFIIELAAPQIAERTVMKGSCAEYNGSAGNARMTMGIQTDTTAFDGFLIRPNAGTIDGKVFIYGYAK